MNGQGEHNRPPPLPREWRALTAQESPSSREGSARTQPRPLAPLSSGSLSPSHPAVGEDQPHKGDWGRGEVETLGKPNKDPPSARLGPLKVTGDGTEPSSLCSRKQVTAETCSLGRNGARSPARPSAYVRPTRSGAQTPQSARTVPPGSLRPVSPPASLSLPSRTAGRPGPTGRPGLRGGWWRPPAAARFPGEEQRIAQASGSGEGAEEGERRKRDLNERR